MGESKRQESYIVITQYHHYYLITIKSHYYSNELGVKSLIMQFKVYANEREGDVYAEMIQVFDSLSE